MSSLKFEIETWAAALDAYDAKDWDAALRIFSEIADSSKILTNIGLIYASLGEHEVAVDNFRAATGLDEYLGIAYFQAGVSNFLLGRFDAALADFQDAFEVLRGHEAINYEQIGLKYQLHAAAVLFNQGVTLINMGNEERGMQLIRDAQAAKAVEEHNVIDEAVRDRAEGYSVFCIPIGVLYRPNEKKIANMRSKDYLGKARLISNTNSRDDFAVFPGASRLAEDRAAPLNGKPKTLVRSRSAAVLISRPSTASGDSPPAVTRIGRSATVGGATPARPATANGAAPPTQDILRPLVSRSASKPQAAGQPRPPPMARRPTLKLANNPQLPPPIAELPPTPPQSDRAVSPDVPAIVVSKSQRLLVEVEREARRGPLRVMNGIAEAPPTPIGEIYAGYLTEKIEEENEQPEDQYFGLNALLKGVAAGRGASLLEGTIFGDESPSPLEPLPNPIPLRSIPEVTRSAFSNEGSRAFSDAGTTDSGVGSSTSGSTLLRIRVKLYHVDDIRGMVIDPTISLPDFRKRVNDKFQLSGGKRFRMKFEDDDGTKVNIMDDDDWEMAVETARLGALGSRKIEKRGEGKLKIWCEDA